MISHAKYQNVDIAFRPCFSRSTSTISHKRLQQQVTEHTQRLLPVRSKNTIEKKKQNKTKGKVTAKAFALRGNDIKTIEKHFALCVNEKNLYCNSKPKFSKYFQKFRKAHYLFLWAFFCINVLFHFITFSFKEKPNYIVIRFESFNTWCH